MIGGFWNIQAVWILWRLQADDCLIAALPVVFVLALSPESLEGGLTLAHGYGIIEIPLSVALLQYLGGRWQCLRVSWSEVSLLCLSLLGFLGQQGVAFFLLFLLQSLNHAVDGFHAVCLRHL